MNSQQPGQPDDIRTPLVRNSIQERGRKEQSVTQFTKMDDDSDFDSSLAESVE